MYGRTARHNYEQPHPLERMAAKQAAYSLIRNRDARSEIQKLVRCTLDNV
jgi:hypothetical protein